MTTAAKIGSFTNRGQSKVERYKWTLVDEPGVFEEIGKEDLITDPIYPNSVRTRSWNRSSRPRHSTKRAAGFHG
jgi:hypothetical protein